MPRISRHVVQFNANGKQWEARSGHIHALPGSDGYRCADGITVEHVTDCFLTDKQEHKTVVGTSRCSLVDEYRWQFGVKVAYGRCLVALGLAKELRDSAGTPKFTYAEGKREAYNKMMREFYEEMKVRQRTLTEEQVSSLEAMVAEVRADFEKAKREAIAEATPASVPEAPQEATSAPVEAPVPASEAR